jgi:hypothetical protein
MADEPSPVLTSIADEHIISTTSSISNTLVLDKKTDFVTCTAPPPDASFNQGSQASITGLINVGGANDSGGIGEGEESRETGLGGRSPAVLFSRDIFFRACEFSRNYELSKPEAIDLYKSTLQAAGTAFQNEMSSTGEIMTKAVTDDAELEETESSSPN